MIGLLNLVFGILFLCYCHFIDGPVTKALKEELKALEAKCVEK